MSLVKGKLKKKINLADCLWIQNHLGESVYVCVCVSESDSKTEIKRDLQKGTEESKIILFHPSSYRGS